MSIQQIQQRWDTFLLKIEERFRETLIQASAILPSLLDYRQFDTVPFANAWTGIETQAKDLIMKIEDCWHEKVATALDEYKETREREAEEAGEPLEQWYEQFYQLYYAECDKGNLLRRKLEKELKHCEVITFASAAEKLVARAQEILSGGFSCTQCKGPLPVKQQFFRSYYQTCDFCQTVNTFEPGTIARNVEHFAMHSLAEKKALDEYFVYWEAEEQFRSRRDDAPPVISSQQVLEVYKVYVEKYLKARIEIVPEYQQQYEKDLAAKIEQVRKWVLGEHGLN